jgi:hypothetical protein
MSVELVGIAFDHGGGSAQTRALHIRYDRATAAPANVAAYALVPTKGQQLTIEVTLRFPHLAGAGLAAGDIVRVRARAASTHSDVLGNVREQDLTVPAANGKAAFVFELAAPKLHVQGIGIYTVVWEWQFQLTPTSPWVPFHTSSATIYVTLDVPSAPWTQATDPLSQRRWPWIRMLKLACGWAGGVKLTTKAAAAKKVAQKIERGVYGLGESGKFVYISSGNGKYCVGVSAGEFKATTFLDDVEGSQEGFEIYCTECAAAVAIAVNCLGGDLALVRLDRVGRLHLNSYILIGKTTANEGTFDFHDIAVRTTATSRQVFDATLKPDWDVNVSNKTHDYRLTQGRRLGKKEVKPTGTAYLQRLLEGDIKTQWNDLALCDVAVPCLDQCDGGPPPPDPCTDRRFQVIQLELAQAVPLQPVLYPQPALILAPQIEGFRVVGRVDDPARLRALAPLVSTSAEFLYVAASDAKHAKYRGRSRAKADRRQFKLTVSWSPTAAAAWDALAWLMVRTPAHLSPFPADKDTKLGDVARGSARDGVAYLVRGNVLMHVAKVGEPQPPTEMIARRVDQAILQRWSSPAHEPPPGTAPSSSNAGRKVRQTVLPRSDT